MPVLGGLVVVIQLCFAYHALKTGRARWWLFVIVALPVAGGVLYYLIEMFPTSRERRRVEKAMRSIVASFDPEKELRERAAGVQACSIANRVALARACIAQG